MNILVDEIDVFSHQREIVKPGFAKFQTRKLVSKQAGFIGTHFVDHGSFILLHGERLVRPTLQKYTS